MPVHPRSAAPFARVLFAGLTVFALLSAASFPARAPLPAPAARDRSNVERPSIERSNVERPTAPLLFIENAGQFDEAARFLARGAAGGGLWLAGDALWLTALERPGAQARGEAGTAHPLPLSRLHPLAPSPRRGVNLRLSFPGANPHPRLEPFNRLETRVSYLLGSDPAGWRPDVPAWGGVRYVDLYPGIDLELSGEGGAWRQRLILHPGADPGAVRLRVEGADSLALAGDDLLATTAVGNIRLPLLQVAGAASAGLPAPTLAGDHLRAPFAPSAPHPQPAPAIPQAGGLVFSTFLGGSSDDYADGLAVDGSGNAYLTGGTSSAGFPTTPGAFQTANNGSVDIFVSKMNAAGSALLYSTYLGGTGDESGYRLAVDGSGITYVTGATTSSDFPTTPGAYDTTLDGSADAFIVGLNASGTGLLYGTFLGGSGDDQGNSLAVDGGGSVTVTGSTSSGDFPSTPGAFDPTFDGWNDAFVTKLDAAGSGLLYSTFLGGAGLDIGYSLAMDASGNAFVAGYATSSDFPTTPGAFDTTYGGEGDGFVTKLNADGSASLYSTFLGGNDYDEWSNLALDRNGNAFVTGYTLSGDFPTTPGAFDTTFKGGVWGDAFVTKLNAAGSGLLYSTFLGGELDDYGYRIAVDWSGNATVTGYSDSSDFPVTSGAFDTNNDVNGDAIVTKLNAAGSALVYSTFLGGRGGDWGANLAVDGNGNATVTGYTESNRFPTTAGAFDTTYNGAGDAYLTKLAVGGSFTDVPGGYWAFAYVESLAASAITSGCSARPPLYCPEDSVTRAQMAIFLERGIHGSDYAPPAATGTMFDDLPASYWAAAWIEQLARDGITGGCGGGNYCPESSVTRAQMAVFLLRSEHGASYQPPPATGAMFTDVPVDYWAAAWIEQLATEGITSGCGGGLYCPEGPVTRAQMAVFLVRTFNLPVP